MSESANAKFLDDCTLSQESEVFSKKSMEIHIFMFFL